MAHFAQLDTDNVVTQVIVVDDKDCLGPDGLEQESVGIVFCKSLFGEDTVWVQTSYNNKIRKNYAGVGYTYNPDIDAFVPPPLFFSWVLNNDTARWEAPVAMPDDGQMYAWNEETTSWDVVQQPE